MREPGRLVALIILASAAVAAVGQRGTDAAHEPLAFDMPSLDELRTADRRVYAHYHPAFPISMDNEPAAEDYYSTQFLTPDGERGKHSAYGGYLRARPLPRAVEASPDWALEDTRTEVERAVQAGLDGFVVDVFGLEGSNWEQLLLLLDAASDVDPAFDIVLAPNANTGAVADIEALADSVASVADHPSAARDGIGRLVIAPFLAEGVGADYWAAWIAAMADRGVEIAFVPILLDYDSNIGAFADLSVGVAAWGPRSLAGIEKLTATGQDAAARGLFWMQPVAMQDSRPKAGVFDEPDNTETLRAMWATADAVDARWVDIVTWNDYSEATQFAPSTNIGWSLLDINAYYLVAFKTGTPPPIVRDRIFVSHRIQPVDAAPSGDQTLLMEPRPASSPPNDEVEVLTFLRTGATVEVRVGASSYTYEAPAGVHAQLFPLETGVVAATSRAADDYVASVTSPYEVVDDPAVQDLEYRVVGSGRNGEHAEAGEPAEAATAAPATTSESTSATTTAPAASTTPDDSPSPTSGDGSDDIAAVTALDASASSDGGTDDGTGRGWILAAIAAVLAVVIIVAVARGRALRRRPGPPRSAGDVERPSGTSG